MGSGRLKGQEGYWKMDIGSVVLQTVDVASTVINVVYIAAGLGAVAGIVVAIYVAVSNFIVTAAKDDLVNDFNSIVDLHKRMNEQLTLANIEETALAKAQARGGG